MSDRQIDTHPKKAGQPLFSSNGKPPGNNHHQIRRQLSVCGRPCGHEFRHYSIFPRVDPRGRAIESQALGSHENSMPVRNQIFLRHHARNGPDADHLGLPKVRGGQFRDGESDHPPTIGYRRTIRFAPRLRPLNQSSCVSIHRPPPRFHPHPAPANQRPRADRFRCECRLRNRPAPSEAAPAVPAPQFCLKHMGQLTTHRCLICQKPICPQCMELFGFVCSALCKGKAETQRTNLPVYAHQKSAVEARQWRKTGLIAGAITTVIAAALGLWIWYAWIASVPKAVFSVRFQQAGYSGQCRLVPRDQVLYLHGGTLARHDLKTKKEIWSVSLIDRKQIAEDAAAMVKQVDAVRDEVRAKTGEGWMTPTLPETIESMQSGAAGALQLHARSENVWVSFSDKLVRYDWQTGKPAQEIPLGEFSPQIVANGE